MNMSGQPPETLSTPEPSSQEPTRPPGRPWSDRLDLTNRLVAAAIRHYREMRSLNDEIVASTPDPLPGPLNSAGEPHAEFLGWTTLTNRVENAVEAAEIGLADAINELAQHLTLDGPKLSSPSGPESFKELGVRFEGATYVLTDDPSQYEQGIGIILALPSDSLINLD
jgi:hypothetical protein